MTINKINNEVVEPIELTEIIATEADAKAISELQTKIRETALRDKNGNSVFAADSEEFVSSIIKSKRGDILLYFNGDDFVGFFEFTCPDNPYDLEEEYGLSEHLPHEDINNMGVAESFVVMPKYRGNGLQYKMFKRMEEIAEERGVTSIVGTVHAENVYSCRNFDLAGYQTVATIEAPYGKRLLEFKPLYIKEEINNHDKGSIRR